MATLQNIKNHVVLAIDAMEGLYNQGSLLKPSWQPYPSAISANNSKLGAALMVVGRFRNEPVISDQVRIISKQTFCRRFQTVWFVRSHTAGKIIFTAMCSLARVSIEKIVAGELTEDDFGRLTCAAAHFSNAPLRICEISSADQFKESIEVLAMENSFCFALCDWELEGEDLEVAEKFARTSSLTFICPR